MDDLLDAMRRCRSVQACIDLALTDAYGAEEEAVGWLTCIETMFGRFKEVQLLGNPVQLIKFDLDRHCVVAVCRQGQKKARVTLDSIEFTDLTPIESRWLEAWKFSVSSTDPADRVSRAFPDAFATTSSTKKAREDRGLFQNCSCAGYIANEAHHYRLVFLILLAEGRGEVQYAGKPTC